MVLWLTPETWNTGVGCWFIVDAWIYTNAHKVKNKSYKQGNQGRREKKEESRVRQEAGNEIIIKTKIEKRNEVKGSQTLHR